MGLSYWTEIGPKKRITEIYSVGEGGMAQFVIIPGNPGSSKFYVPFVEFLYGFMNKKVDIKVISHLGHDGDGDGEEELFSLNDQIEHKIDALEELVFVKGNPPVVIICHSIGCFMVMNALKKIEELSSRSGVDLLKVVAMFPFLEADFSIPRVRTVHLLSTWYRQIGIVGDMIGSLPDFVKGMIFKTASKDALSGRAVETCCKLCCRIRQYFYLASFYVVRDKRFDWDIFLSPSFLKLFTILACPNDTWMPVSLYDSIVDRFPGVDIRWCADQSHAFVVSDSMCMQAGKIISEIFREI